ncbi:EamA family transporter [Stenotrophomonas sp. SY1]|uniref:EamA family transporter n=1 Tax=Stenotrophomonas sp. SY1 TaxID=477235 RepID=UPI001E5FB7FE|nr:EamA family transporter [Stenotrophomonas sp. SY1]MCD9085914.1 EamA family transporter [Stenotrophomonas sp. SY1]
MSLGIFCAVLFAALLHASWNAIVKLGGDKLLTTILVTGWAALLSALVLPWLPLPAPASWPWLAVSALLQTGYYVLVARAYHAADMSLSYPLMRGCAPLLVALAGTVVFNEYLPISGWAGIALVSTGILCMAGSGNRRNIQLPLFIALLIAAYTLVDAQGARRSGHALSYTLWLFLLSGLPLPLWALFKRRAQLQSYLHDNWARGLIGGIGTTASYGIALWAMTQAPVAVVAALRETSILFALLISALLLRERISRRRMLAAVLIVVGVLLLRLG